MILKKHSAIYVGIAILGFVAAVSLQNKSASALNSVMERDDRYYLPPSQWIRVFSFGYNEAAADLIWVKTIVYFGEKMTEKKSKAGSQFVMNYLLSAVDLDPRFRNMYVAGSTLTMFQNRGRVSEKTIQMAMDLLERGVSEFPDDGEILFSLGFLHYYEMARFLPEDPDDPLHRKHKNLGRYYIGRSALMRGAPPYAALLSASLMLKGDMDTAVLEHLKTMLVRETDPAIREELIDRIRKEAGKAAEKEIAATEQLQKEWRSVMPYVPFDFYTILRNDLPVEERIDPLFFSNKLLELSLDDIDNDVDNETNSEELSETSDS